MSLVERPVRPADAEAVAALVRACDETYADWLPNGWTPPEVGAEWAARFAEPDRWSLVVEDAERVVGLVSFRPAYEEASPAERAGALLPGVAQVGALLVHPGWWRRGIATRILGRAEQAARERGFVRAVLWTPEGAPAERFYAAQGWQRDGRRGWHKWGGMNVVGYAKRL